MTRRLHRLPLALTVIMLVVVVGRLSHAYQLRESVDGQVLIWGTSQVKLQIDTSVVAGVGGAADAVRAGFYTWTSAGVPQQITFKMGKSLKLATDGTNAVLWQTSDWKYGQEVVAMTVSSYKRSTGIVTETDIVLNARDHTWNVDPAAGSGAYDVQNVVTHEAGHFFGLGHSSVLDATMYPTTPTEETGKRTLSADDRAGIGALLEEINSRHGSSKTKSDVGEEVGQSVETQTTMLPERNSIGCAVGGSHGHLALWPVLLLGLLRLRRRGLLLLLALSPTTAGATVVQRLALEQMHREASIVLRGEVVARHSHLTPGYLVLTDHTIRVHRCYKAPAGCNATVTLRTLGGEVGDRGMQVEGMPRLEPGQRVILFGRTVGGRLLPVGLAQGVYQLRGGQAERDLRGLDLVRRSASLNSGADRATRDHGRGTLERVSVEQLEHRLRELATPDQ